MNLEKENLVSIKRRIEIPPEDAHVLTDIYDGASVRQFSYEDAVGILKGKTDRQTDR